MYIHFLAALTRLETMTVFENSRLPLILQGWRSTIYPYTNLHLTIVSDRPKFPPETVSYINTLNQFKHGECFEEGTQFDELKWTKTTGYMFNVIIMYEVSQ